MVDVKYPVRTVWKTLNDTFYSNVESVFSYAIIRKALWLMITVRCVYECVALDRKKWMVRMCIVVRSTDKRWCTHAFPVVVCFMSCRAHCTALSMHMDFLRRVANLYTKFSLTSSLYFMWSLLTLWVSCIVPEKVLNHILN